MNAEVKAKWVKALRSGEYKQTDGGLRENDNFCCLGVLCDLYDPTLWDASTYRVEGACGVGYPPRTVKEWADLSDEQVEVCAERNDNGDSFAQIADYIEANL